MVQAHGLQSRQWLLSYKTSSTIINGRPVDMLHDFYIPALSLAVKYDRVAGYFRSSSLAAASQGFSAFIGRGGKMRLIVGADLEPEDVKAILKGDSLRLAANLNKQLDHSEIWSKEVKNGVNLLAWMVAHGYLEVKVAFRLHRVTGEPLTIDSVADGYVHEKWFILTDEFGNRLYGSGTLNESRTAYVYNAENLDIHCDWWGDREQQRVEEAVKEFEQLWTGQVAHMPVFTLPEAVRLRLIKFAENLDFPVEVDGTRAYTPPVKPPSALERLKFALIKDGPRLPGGKYVGLETAPVEPWPHQKMVVRKLIDTWPYSYLLCDEVGLGKTIEAGLAIRSLYLSGLVKRILIAAPASLTIQWQRQMAEKMLLPFALVKTSPEICHEYIFPRKENRPASNLFDKNLMIASTGILVRQERKNEVHRALDFDIVLLDEAHYARRQNPAAGLTAYPEFGQLYELVRDILRRKAKSLWLATATPMQIHPVEVCDLLALTNRAGAFQFDPTLTLQYYEVLAKILYDQSVSQEEWDFLHQVVNAVKSEDPMVWDYVQECVVDHRNSAFRNWINYGRIPRNREKEHILKVLFAISPLGRVMLRHNRQLLEIYREKGQLQQNLAKRHVQTIPVEFTPLEREIYDDLEKYCKELSRQINTSGSQPLKQMLTYMLSFLRLRFASSLFALRETLKRRLDKVEATLKFQASFTNESESTEMRWKEVIEETEYEEDEIAVESLLKHRNKDDLEWEKERLTEMLNKMQDISWPSSKMQKLLSILDQRRNQQSKRLRQTVIFTRFYDTLKDIVFRLQQVDPYILVGTYSGQGAEYFDPQTGRMVTVDREVVKERFLRGEIDILVCTDAAAEGLNLQTADMLINFDLGWNPMKVEQRIGRIDRIGQKYENIFVINLCYLGSAEEIVYGRLLDRLAKANLIVGIQQISLLPIEPEEFRQLTEGELTEEELEQRAKERIMYQKQQNEKMEIKAEDLYNIYLKMEEKYDKQKAPVDLSAIWEGLAESEYLQNLGCEVEWQADEPLLKLNGIANIPSNTRLTVSRNLYEQGAKVRDLHFASYGDPVFDILLDHISSFDLPKSVKRISVVLEGNESFEFIGYGVACRGPNGTREILLLLCFNLPAILRALLRALWARMISTTNSHL